MSENAFSAPVAEEPSVSPESVEGQPENLEAAPEAPQEKKEVKEEPKSVKKQLKKLKIKVDGKEEDLEFDPEDEEFLRKNFQLSRAAQKRMSEKAQLEKQVEYFINELKNNPRKILADPNIGIDVKKLAAEIIEEEIQNSQKTPEQLKAEQLERELKELKEQREKESEEFKRKEFERIQEREFERYDQLMTQALDSSDLPKSPYVVKKLADYMLVGLQNGMDVTPQDVLPLVREEMMNDIKQMFSIMPEEVIEQIVGKDVINKIRKKSISKAKQAPTTNPISSSIKDVGQTSSRKEEKPAKKMTIREMFGV